MLRPPTLGLLALSLVAGCVYPDAPAPSADANEGPPEIPPTIVGPPPRAPAGPPPGHDPIERPPVPDPALDGPWPIKEFSVSFDPPKDTWLASYDTFGVQIRFGERSPFGPRSSIDLGTNCDGTCVPEEFAERIQSRAADRIFQNVSREAKTAEWVVRPTEFEPGRWWMHLRGIEEDGSTAIERVEVDTIAPESKTGWFRCNAELRPPHLDRLEEAITFCKEIVPSFVGDVGAPDDDRFDSKYPLRGVVLEVPTPDDFRFARYSPEFSQLEFRAQNTMNLSSMMISTGCEGSCRSQDLVTNLKTAYGERLAELKKEGRVFEVETPLTDLGEGRWITKLHFSKAGRYVESTEIDVYALRPGVERFLHCRVRLEGTKLTRVEEFEKRCLKILDVW